MESLGDAAALLGGVAKGATRAKGSDIIDSAADALDKGSTITSEPDNEPVIKKSLTETPAKSDESE